MDFETLSNKELHNICIERGMPNIPVTDTSRKIIIKRLTNAIADDKKEKAKARRETIHAPSSTTIESKPESPKKPTKATSRKTISVPKEIIHPIHIETVPPEPKAAPVVNRRRSTRASPVPESEIVASSRIPSTSVIQEGNEDDIIFVYAENSEKDTQRKSRSPSLSKSDVVKTSFKSTIVPEPIIESVENIDVEYHEVPPTITSRQPRISPLKTTTRISPVKTNISRARLEQTSYGDKETRSYLGGESSSSSYLNREPSYLDRHSTSHYYSSSSKPPEITSTYSKSYSSDKTTNRRLVSNFYPDSAYSGGIATSRSLYNENSDDNAEDNPGKNIEAPHLRNFARRLSVLRERDIGTILTKDNNYRSHLDRRYTSTYRKDDSVVDSFRKFWFALDRKYDVSKYAALLAIILAFVFVFIFLIH